MDKHKAAEMIQKQRRRGCSLDSDLAIARRAERVYLALGYAYLCLASSFIALFQYSSLFALIVGPSGFFIAAVIFYWHSRRFGQIKKLLSNQLD